MNEQDSRKAVKDVWKTELSRTGINEAIKSAEECCGVGCERCVWELTWIIRQLLEVLKRPGARG